MNIAQTIICGLLGCTGLVGGVMGLNIVGEQQGLQRARLQQETQQNHFRLTPEAASGVRIITIEDGTVEMKLQSLRDPNVSLGLTDPSGQTIDARSIGNNTFTEHKEDGKIAETIVLNNPAAGKWSATYRLREGNGGRARLLSTLTGENALSAKIAYEDSRSAGRAFPIALRLFKGGAPVTDANIEMKLKKWETEEEITLQLFDNGDQSNGDEKAGDGVYSGMVAPLPAADYLGVAQVKTTWDDAFSVTSMVRVRPEGASARDDLSAVQLER